MKLVLIRHGESEWNLENRFTGWTDVELSETGMKEAAKAGQELKAASYRESERYNCQGCSLF